MMMSQSSPPKRDTFRDDLQRLHNDGEAQPPRLGESQGFKLESKDRYYGMKNQNFHLKIDRNIIQDEITKVSTHLKYLQELIQHDKVAGQGGAPGKHIKMDRESHKFIDQVSAQNFKLRGEVKNLQKALQNQSMKPTIKRQQKVMPPYQPGSNKRPISAVNPSIYPYRKDQSSTNKQNREVKYQKKLIDQLTNKLAQQEKFIKSMGETGYPMTNKSGVGVNPSVVAQKDRKIRKLQNDIEQARKRQEMFDQSKRYFDEMLKEATLKNKQVNDMDTKMRMLEVDAQQAKDLQIQLNDTLAEKYVLQRKIQDLVESPFIKNVEGESSTYKRLGQLQKSNLEKEDEIKFMKEKLRQYTEEMKNLKDENQIYKSQNDKLSKRYQGMGINMEQMAQMLKSLDPTKMRNYSFEHLSYEGKTPAWAHMDFMERSKPLDIKDSSSLVRQIDRLQGQKALLASELEKAQFLIREQIDIQAQLKETHQNSVDQLRAQIQNANRQVARAQIDKKRIEDQLQELKGQYLQKGGKLNFDRNIPGGDVSVFSSDTVDTILGPQQNVIDLLLSTADYDKIGLQRVLQNFDMHQVQSSISTFFTLDFFSHQPHTTMQVAGLNPQFDVQISYKDKIDRFFIQQAKNNQVNIVIEVYYPLPDKILLLGKATIPIKNLVQQANHSSSPIIHSSAMIYSSSGNVSIGFIQYHLRFRQSIKQALGDFSSQQQFLNSHSAMNALTHADDSSLLSDGKRVRVQVTIHRASELTRGGHSSVPINAFVNYTFYNQSSRYTPAVKSSSPVFEYTYSYDFTADESLRRYIANEKIKFLVFDDSQPLGRPGEVSQDMLGVCQVPIRQLLTGNHRLQDIFPIMSRTDIRGNLAVTIQLINIRGQDARHYNAGAQSRVSEEWKDRFLEKIVIKLMERKLDIDQAFRQFDIDADRIVNAQDFRTSVIKLKAQVSDAEIDSFLRESVIKKDGGLDRAQFHAIFMPAMQNLKINMQRMVIEKFKEACFNQGRDQMLREFQRQDYNKRGQIDEQGFKNVLRAFNLNLSNSEFDSLWGQLQTMGQFEYTKWTSENRLGGSNGISRKDVEFSRIGEQQFETEDSFRGYGDVAKVKLIEFLDSRDMPLDSFFSVADRDKNNKISRKEFKALLEPMKAAKLNSAEIDGLFELLDQNNSEAIQMRELQIGLNLYNIRHIIKKVHSTIVQSGFNLIQLFQIYSKANDYLQKQDLHSMLSEIGSKISADQATAFMTYFDTRKNNRIDITEFIQGFYKAIQFDGYQIPLQKIISRINKKIRISSDSVKQALGIFDKNKNKMISFYEFIAVLETQFRVDLSRKQKNTIRNFFYEHEVTTDSLEINQNVIFNLINMQPKPRPKVANSVLTAAVKKLQIGLQQMKIQISNFLRPFQKGEGEFQIYCLASAAIEFGKLEEKQIDTLINACDIQNHGMIDVRMFQQLMKTE